MRFLYLATTLAVCSAISHGRSSVPQARRRRRRSVAEDGINCDVVKKVMSELLAMQKELRSAKEDIKELQSAKQDMQKELQAMKEQLPPFKVSPKDKTVWLQGWNLHIVPDSFGRDCKGNSKGGRCDHSKGNLIVGLGHDYTSSTASLFSGQGHVGFGHGLAFLGGTENTAGRLETPAYFAALASGFQNRADGECFVGGGQHNECSKNASYGAVLGGSKNKVEQGTGTIVGGGGNRVTAPGGGSTVVGGSKNYIRSGHGGTITGGQHNEISSSFASTVSGGESNTVSGDCAFSSVNGGFKNSIAASFASIAGGRQNKIEHHATFSTIAGGRLNHVYDGAVASSIGGGFKNRISQTGFMSSIAGGWENKIGSSFAGAIAGGFGNIVDAKTTYGYAGTVAGGANNTMSASFSSIAGGLGNFIGGGSRGYCNPEDGGCYNFSAYHTISGGAGNSIDTTGMDAFNNALVGGQNNSILIDSSFSTVLGGRHEKIVNKSWSVVVGGLQQTVEQSVESSQMDNQQLSEKEHRHYRDVLEGLSSYAKREMHEAEQAAKLDLEKLIQQAELSTPP